MSRNKIVTILLWLFVINLGIALGAGLYERIIVVPQWLVCESGVECVWDAEAAREADTGLRFWVYVTTGPLTLLTLASLVVAWRKTKGVVRKWWLGAAGAELVARIMTFAYFIPTMITLMSGEVAQSEAVRMASQWVQLGAIRHILGVIALLAALKAFSEFYKQNGFEKMNGE